MGENNDVNLEKIKKELKNSYLQLQKIIENHSDEELLKKKRYKWTGTTSLGAYLISATSSHYDWAYKLIKKTKKYKLLPTFGSAIWRGDEYILNFLFAIGLRFGQTNKAEQ